jgi:acyl-CoA synthetase (AMP-forming)/AMP-acid ligase II
VGELMGRGENIMRGYFKDADLTAKKLGPEGYHTGDLCYRDSEGFYFLVGRQDDLVKVGGHKVNPREIEDAILASDLVVEIAVVALPDPLLGNALAALAVKADDTVDAAALADYCQRNLARFKQPASFMFARALPKKPSGKIDRFECAALLKARLDHPGRSPGHG